jgi:hypothetical protein
MPDVSRISGSVEIQGLDQAVQGLTTLSTVFGKAGDASTAALRQINNFGAVGQSFQTAASGTSTLTAANQRLAQSATNLVAADRQRIAAATQIAQLQQRVAAAETDAAGRVQLYTQAVAQATAGSREYYQAQLRLISAQKELERAQSGGTQGTLQRAISGGAGQVLGAIGLVGGVAAATQQLNQYSLEGQQLIIAQEGIRRSLGALIGDQTRANTVFAQATEFAQRYKLTQEETGQAVQSASLLIKNSTAPVEKILEVMTRLSTLAPEQGISGAGFAIRELASGDIQSIADRFNVGRARATEWRDAIVAGGDAVEVLDKGLRDLGVGQESLTTLTKGAVGAQRDYNKALEDFKLTLGEIRQASGAQQGQTDFLRALTGGLNILQGKTSLDSLVKSFEDAQKQVGSSGTVFGSFALVIKSLANAQDNLTRSINEGMASRTKDDLVTTALAHSTALSKEEIDRLSTSLATITDRTLRPYKAAVDAAKVSLDAHKASTQAAKDSVDSISASLDTAKARFQEFAQAQLAGTKAYADQQFALDQQSAKVQKSLLEFQAPGAGLDQLLAPIQSQIDAAAASTDDWKQKLDAANQAVSDQEQVLAGATAEQKNYDTAVGDAKDNLDAQQSRLESLQGVYDNLGESIQSAKRDMDDLRHTALVGEGALDDQLFDGAEHQAAAVPDRPGAARWRRQGRDQALTEQLDKLRTAEDAARLSGELRYDAQHRRLSSKVCHATSRATPMRAPRLQTTRPNSMTSRRHSRRQGRP